MRLRITVDLPDHQAPDPTAGEVALILADVAAWFEAHPQYIASEYSREIMGSDGKRVGERRFNCVLPASLHESF